MPSRLSVSRASLTAVLLLCAAGVDAQTVAATGETRALIVFIQFADDEDAGDPCLDERGWPLGADLPAFANTLLADSPTPPFADSTLTAYFYQLSGQQFTFYGDVYPRVIETWHPRKYYHRTSRRGYGHLTEEILDRIDGEVDFRSYDTNPVDGVVDQLFLIVRSDEDATFTGVARLDGADALNGRPGNTTLVYDGVTVDWTRSGSYLIHTRPGHILTQPYYIRLLAHEFGHHLWNSRGVFAGHLPAITRNRIPSNDTGQIGYVLMAGRGGGRDAGGDLLISAPERDALGWGPALDVTPNPDVPEELAGSTTVFLRDYYATGDAAVLRLLDGDPATRDPELYLVNRQRLGRFDQRRVHRKAGCASYDMGLLRDTGVLVHLVERRAQRIAIDVIPADNTLELSLDTQVYAGDLFGPASQTQLTPWTRPALRRPDGAPSWAGVDRIGYIRDGVTAMSVDIVPDVRQQPVFRADAWIGPETTGYQFAAPMLVEAGRRVTFTETDIAVADLIRLEPSSRLRIQAGATVTLTETSELDTAAGTVIEIFGTLRMNGRVADAATGRYVVRPGGRLELPGRTIAPDRTERIRIGG